MTSPTLNDHAADLRRRYDDALRFESNPKTQALVASQHLPNTLPDRQVAIAQSQFPRSYERLIAALGALTSKLDKSKGVTTPSAMLNPASSSSNTESSVSTTTDKLVNLKTSLGTVAATFETVFSRGQQSIMSMVAAADPSAFSTFNASLTQLSIQVGQIFVPYVSFASEKIQQLAGWFDGLSDSTKTTIGRVSMFALALGGIATVGRMLSPIIAAATGAITLLSRAAAFSPVGAIVTLTAAVGGLAAAWYAVGQNTKSAAEGMIQAGNVQVPISETLTEAQLQSLPKRIQDQYKAAHSPDDRKEVLRQYQQETNSRPQILSETDLKQLPVEIQKKLEGKKPDEARQILTEHEQSLTQERTTLLGQQPANLIEMQKSREVLMKDVDAAVRQVNLQFIKAQTEFRVRTKLDPAESERTQTPFSKSTEFKVYQTGAYNLWETLATNLAGKQRDLGLPAETPQKWFDRLTVESASNGPKFKGLPDLPILPATIEKLKTLNESIAITKSVIAKTGEQNQGANPGFAQNIKMPFQSRYSDFSSYGESVQLASLNQGDLDAKNLADQMKNLANRIGDGAKALQEFMQRRDAQMFQQSWFSE